jgi:hypothetical protein
MSTTASLSSANQAYLQAFVKGGRWPEAEAVIVQHPQWAYFYAKNIIQGRWPEAEPIIAASQEWAIEYARYIVKGRWPEGEPIIVLDAWAAHYYARDIIKSRWLEAEPLIAKSPLRSGYLKDFPGAGDDWILNGLLDWMET